MVHIYGLIDPKHPDKIRYIGKTKSSLRKRLQSHISSSKKEKSYKSKWIRSLLKKNIRPKITLIEDVDDLNWKEREIHWIKTMKENYKLTNGTKGGETFSIVNYSKIIAYNLNGDLYKIFESVEQACNELQYPRGRINSALQRKRKGGNYLWLYYTDNYKTNITAYNFPKNTHIHCLNTNNNKTYEFPSIKECLEYFNIKRTGSVNRSIDEGKLLNKRFILSRIN